MPAKSRALRVTSTASWTAAVTPIATSAARLRGEPSRRKTSAASAAIASVKGSDAVLAQERPRDRELLRGPGAARELVPGDRAHLDLVVGVAQRAQAPAFRPVLESA